METVADEALLKQKELEAFYATYDVWTGIRTAITLSLFFVFTVSVIVYKSRCKKASQYELYPSAEDMPGRQLDYCEFWCTSPLGAERSSKRIGMGRCYEQTGMNMGSAPLPTQGSVGSYTSLSNSFRVKSLPGSVMAINWSRMSSYDKEDGGYPVTTSDILKGGRGEFLRVPGTSAPSSDGCSSGSSTHDLAGDLTNARLGVPGARTRPQLQLGGMDWVSDQATAEWLQTIDINVIQPTPNISPCSSVRSMSDHASLGTDHLSIHPSSAMSQREEGSRSDPILFGESACSFDETLNNKPLKRARRATQPNLLNVASISPKSTTLLGLPASTHLRGSTEKLSIQSHRNLSRESSGVSLQVTSSIDDDPQLISFKVPNLRRTHSASTNGARNNSVKARNTSPVKRADSESQPVKRSLCASESHQDSQESTSSTDEASESVSFHLMVPQLSIDCPSQDVSQASSPSLSPTPPQSPASSRSLTKGRMGGVDGRGVLTRQYAKDLTQPSVMLPTYLEEEEPNEALLDAFLTLRPPPGYRDPSPLPPVQIVTSLSPTISMTSSLPASPFAFPLSPTGLSSTFFAGTGDMSPLQSPSSPLLAFGKSSNTARSSLYQKGHKPLKRTRSPILTLPSRGSPQLQRTHAPLRRTYSPLALCHSPMSPALPEEEVLSPSAIEECSSGPGRLGRKTFEFPEDDSSREKVSRQSSMAAMTPISFDEPDSPRPEAKDVHETSC